MEWGEHILQKGQEGKVPSTGTSRRKRVRGRGASVLLKQLWSDGEMVVEEVKEG